MNKIILVIVCIIILFAIYKKSQVVPVVYPTVAPPVVAPVVASIAPVAAPEIAPVAAPVMEIIPDSIDYSIMIPKLSRAGVDDRNKSLDINDNLIRYLKIINVDAAGYLLLLSYYFMNNENVIKNINYIQIGNNTDKEDIRMNMKTFKNYLNNKKNDNPISAPESYTILAFKKSTDQTINNLISLILESNTSNSLHIKIILYNDKMQSLLSVKSSEDNILRSVQIFKNNLMELFMNKYRSNDDQLTDQIKFNDWINEITKDVKIYSETVIMSDTDGAIVDGFDLTLTQQRKKIVGFILYNPEISASSVLNRSNLIHFNYVL